MEPEKEPVQQDGKEAHERHLQFPRESSTEIDAEGSDSEMAEGRQTGDPFYTPLVTEAAERKLKKERESRRASRVQQDMGEHEGDGLGQERKEGEQR